VSRPIVSVPAGSEKDPASVPSARRAVSVAAAGVAFGEEGVGSGAAAEAGAGGGFVSLKPHDAQNLLLGGFGAEH
jgi:hypothetical protein